MISGQVEMYTDNIGEDSEMIAIESVDGVFNRPTNTLTEHCDTWAIL